MYKNVKPVRAYDLLKIEEEQKINKITTFSEDFDEILGGLIKYNVF